MKNVFDLIVVVVTYIAWLAYTFPPLAAANSTTARVIRRACFYAVCAGFGWLIGTMLAEVL
jgi:hypothetical protein